MDLRRLFYFASVRQTASALAPSAIAEKRNQGNISSPEHQFGSSIEIRRAKLQDLQALTNLLTESFHQTSSQPFWLNSILRFSIQEDLRQRLQHPVSEQTCWVAISIPSDPSSLEPQRLVGVVELGMRSPWTLGLPLSLDSWLGPTRSFLYLSNLAVAHGYRRQGIAQQLINRCEQTAIAWNQPHLYLHVLGKNQGAQNLYKLAGFGFERIDPSIESVLFNQDQRQLWRKPICFNPSQYSNLSNHGSSKSSD